MDYGYADAFTENFPIQYVNTKITHCEKVRKTTERVHMQIILEE